MNRRQFLQTAALAAGAAATGAVHLIAADNAKGVHWPIGCFNRPWVNEPAGLGEEVAFGAIQAAGYKLTGLLTRTRKEPFTGSDATPEYLAALKARIAAHNLRAVMTALRTDQNLSVADSIKDVRKQIDNAKFLELEFALTFGVDNAKDYANYYQVMADAAAYSQERGIKLVLKPHGGGSGAAEEILRCLKEVKHPNFKIWYDAGNIIYYTGKDPLEQLKPIAQHVTGFCAKDCAQQKGEIWLEFGKGRVDFPAVLGELKRAGFNGPVMVECCAKDKTSTIGDITAAAKTNREYLEKLFASL